MGVVSGIAVYDRFFIRFKNMNLIALALSTLRHMAAFCIRQELYSFRIINIASIYIRNEVFTAMTTRVDSVYGNNAKYAGNSSLTVWRKQAFCHPTPGFFASHPRK
jgi:hypothetical protein